MSKRQEHIDGITRLLEGNQSGVSYVNLTNPSNPVYVPPALDEKEENPKMRQAAGNKMRKPAENKEKP